MSYNLLFLQRNPCLRALTSSNSEAPLGVLCHAHRMSQSVSHGQTKRGALFSIFLGLEQGREENRVHGLCSRGFARIDYTLQQD